MLNTLISVVIGILGIGIMVLVHELGHFLAAKSVGIVVEVFSFGMGPAIIKWQRKQTEFRISLLPFGGYCRMRGADDLTRALQEKKKTFTHIEEGSLFATSPLKRFFVYLSGPVCNILFAILVYIIFFMMSYSALSDPPQIVVTDDYPALFGQTTSAAKQGGLHTGDMVKSINGQPVKDYQELLSILEQSDGSTTVFLVDRGEHELTITVIPETAADGTYRFGLTSFIHPKVAKVADDSPEIAAGLEPGDIILFANEQEITNLLDLAQLASSHPQSVELTVQRNNELHQITFIPSADGNETRFNFSFFSETVKKQGYSFGKAIRSAVSQAGNLITATLSTIGNILTGKGKISDSFSGPWRASMMIGGITTQGFTGGLLAGIRTAFYILGVVSVSLAIANLLPIPALDGGLMLMCLVELILRRRVSPRTYLILQFVGFICIITILVVMSLSDMSFLFKRA